ncbi:MAG: hypothetical protein P8Y65_02445 [Campylobacterales bacterium]
MRTIGFMETGTGEKEILPRTYGIESIEARRRMFFALINDSLCEAARIPLGDPERFRDSLHTIFKEKIFSFFQMYRLRPERTQRIVRIHTEESLLFNQFFKQERDAKSRALTQRVLLDPGFSMMAGYAHPAAQLIGVIFDGRNVGLTLDLNRLFTLTVYRRIKREPDAKVTLDSPYIHIDSRGVRTRLYPRWKRLDPASERARSETLKEGARQLSEGDVDQCFLLYPKTEKFRRHIEVKTNLPGR